MQDYDHDALKDVEVHQTAIQEVVGDTQEDSYDINVLAQHAEINYGVPQHDVYGAVSWAKQNNHPHAKDQKLTHRQMQELLEMYLQQEDVTHKKALEARGI